MTGLRYRSADALKTVTPGSARRWLVQRRLGRRRLTSGRRALPDFLVIGAQRCGTSTPFWANYSYTGATPSHSAMAWKTKAHLRSAFSAHNDHLYGLLGKDLGWD